MGLFISLPQDAIPIALGNGYNAHLLPFPRHPRVFDVVYQRVLVGTVLKLLIARQDYWFCATCDKKLHRRRDVVQHHVFAHFAEECHVAGVAAPAVLSVGHVADHGSKSRMPWRVDAPEFH